MVGFVAMLAGMVLIALPVAIVGQKFQAGDSKKIREINISDICWTNPDIMILLSIYMFLYWVGFGTALTLQTHS